MEKDWDEVKEQLTSSKYDSAISERTVERGCFCWGNTIERKMHFIITGDFLQPSMYFGNDCKTEVTGITSEGKDSPSRSWKKGPHLLVFERREVDMSYSAFS